MASRRASSNLRTLSRNAPVRVARSILGPLPDLPMRVESKASLAQKSSHAISKKRGDGAGPQETVSDISKAVAEISKLVLETTKSNNGVPPSDIEYGPLLATAKPECVDALFRLKCRRCSKLNDVKELGEMEDVASKEDLLQEIAGAMSDESLKLADSPENYDAIFALIAIHMFRTPKAPPKEWYAPTGFYYLTDEVRDENWQYSRHVFDIAINFFKRKSLLVDDEKVIRFGCDLIRLVVVLCRECDKRAQEKTVLLFLAIYQRIFVLREVGLNSMRSSLYRVMHEDEPFVSTRPILKAMAPIVAGLSVPLQAVHIRTFKELVLPLHRHPCAIYFHDELFALIIEYLQKSYSLVLDVFNVIVKFWPRKCPHKQMLFIKEIRWFASFVDDDQVDEVVYALIPHLMRSLCGCHMGVTETIMRLWEVTDFVWLVTVNAQITYPMVLPRFFETASAHEDDYIRSEATAVLQIIRDNNPLVFDAVGLSLRRLTSSEVMSGITRAREWQTMILNDKHCREKASKVHHLEQIFVGFDAISAKRR